MSIANQTWESKSINFKNVYDYKTGINLSLTADFLEKKYFVLAADLGFIQKGGILKIETTTQNNPEPFSQTQDFKSTFNYLTISPNIRFKYDINSFSPYLTIGPRVDYLISYAENMNSTLSKEFFSNSVFGISYGAGVQYNKLNTSFLLELQHHYDITPIKDSEPANSNAGLKIKNNAFVVNIGMKYNLVR